MTKRRTTQCAIECETEWDTCVTTSLRIINYGRRNNFSHLDHFARHLAGCSAPHSAPPRHIFVIRVKRSVAERGVLNEVCETQTTDETAPQLLSRLSRLQEPESHHSAAVKPYRDSLVSAIARNDFVDSNRIEVHTAKMKCISQLFVNVNPISSDYCVCMGCLISKAQRNTQAVKNKSKTRISVKDWRSEAPITVEQLRAQREEFWDTQPYYGGNEGTQFRFFCPGAEAA